MFPSSPFSTLLMVDVRSDLGHPRKTSVSSSIYRRVILNYISRGRKNTEKIEAVQDLLLRIDFLKKSFLPLPMKNVLKIVSENSVL